MLFGLRYEVLDTDKDPNVEHGIQNLATRETCPYFGHGDEMKQTKKVY